MTSEYALETNKKSIEDNNIIIATIYVLIFE